MYAISALNMSMSYIILPEIDSLILLLAEIITEFVIQQTV